MIQYWNVTNSEKKRRFNKSDLILYYLYFKYKNDEWYAGASGRC